MVVASFLPKNRQSPGILIIRDEERGEGGTFRCRGEADNTGAAHAGNPEEDPTKPYGDHPYGVYRIIAVEPRGGPTYGPYFVRLDPRSGEALVAAQSGRVGLGIHGGALHLDGSLRETYGCLRVDDSTILFLAKLVIPALERYKEVMYTCSEP